MPRKPRPVVLTVEPLEVNDSMARLARVTVILLEIAARVDAETLVPDDAPDKDKKAALSCERAAAAKISPSAPGKCT